MAAAKHRILIADDNAANRELLEAYLVSVDCEIETSVDGQDTLDKVDSFQPDLVLLDVMMPRLSGFEVCEQIKTSDATRRVMVLMVTALNELGDIERAVNAGTDDPEQEEERQNDEDPAEDRNPLLGLPGDSAFEFVVHEISSRVQIEDNRC